MADKRIKGITVEIGGDTTKLQDALRDVNAQLKTTQSDLRDVNKLLKMDPGNADLLAQKQKYLSEAIAETSEKLKTEKDALAQLQNGPQNEETIRQQEALTREIEDTTQQLKTLKGEYREFGSVAGQQLQVAGDKMKEVGGKISDVGGGLTKGITVPVAAVGAASVAAWKELDEAMDTIATKTGATGPALEDMQNRAQSIAETIPTSFQAASDAVGEVNTRFGLTGDDLEQLSTQFVKFSEINGTEVSSSIDNVSAALAAYGQGAEDASGFLDALNSVGQATGVSVDQLAQDVTKSAAQFTAMGMSAEEAAAVVGAADMAGLDASVMLAGLTTAQKNATNGGKTLSQSLADFSGVMNSNASDTEKLQAAYETFGSKAGASIYNAVDSGALSLDALSGSLADYAGSVSDTFAETLDPLDQMTVVMNNLKGLGAEIVDASAPMIAEAMTQIKDVVTALKGAWDGLSPGMQEAIVKAALIAAAVGPVVVGVGKAVTAVGSVTSIVGKLVGFLSTTAIPAITAVSVPILPIIGIIAAVVAAVVAVIEIVKHWGEITEWFSGVWSTVCSGVQSMGEGLGSFFSGLWDGIKAKTEEVWNGISSFFTGIWDGLKVGAEAVGTAITTAVHGIGDGVVWLWQSVVEPYYEMWFNIGAGIINGVKNTFETVINHIRSIPAKIAEIWGRIKSAIKLPHFSISGSFSLKPPSVPHLAVDWYERAYDNAVMFTSPTVLATQNGLKGFGDGKGGEIVIGEQALMSAIRGAVRSENTGSITVNVYPSQGMDERALADYTIDRLTSQLQIKSKAF